MKRKTKSLSAKKMFSVGDILDTKGKTNMADPVKIVKIKGNTPTFVDYYGTMFTGQSLSTIKRLVEGGSWVKISSAPIGLK